MSDIESIVQTTMGEIEKMVNTKTVVGDPIQIDGKTLIPLISYGFGFGAGYGGGRESMKQSMEGTGGGTGGAAGVKPVAVMVIDSSGVRIESVKSGMASTIEKLGEMIPQMMQKKGQSQSESGSE